MPMPVGPGRMKKDFVAGMNFFHGRRFKRVSLVLLNIDGAKSFSRNGRFCVKLKPTRSISLSPFAHHGQIFISIREPTMTLN